jgi:hypothetical protein
VQLWLVRWRPARPTPAAAAGRRWSLVVAVVLTAPEPAHRRHERRAAAAPGAGRHRAQQPARRGPDDAAVVCFALVGWYAPAVAARLGEHRAVTGALALMTAGLLGRAS